MFRSYTGTLSAFTGAPPGHHRRQPGRCHSSAGVTLFPGAATVETVQQPGRFLVNPGLATIYSGEALTEPRLSPVMPRWRPDESRQRPGRAPVYRNSAGTHRCYTGIRTRQSYGNAPGKSRSVPIMQRRSPGECRWPPGRAPVYRCTIAIPGLCRHSTGIHLGTTGDNRGVAIALSGSL
ncbi:hypothetical protein DPMN_150173 [Dreissena polymorpha]|uniref:Uncharacterized protein n=1 Tax=Dreissena polymorpha TaxID=45954 RepID=A0A9D4FF82_DREPO|nr:hypothetical protein DPMN_150172 [Dreissena polymorpha]KAH3796604.1 hypothetical protein DPMN_150173 [Dreissena polymorpha]